MAVNSVEHTMADRRQLVQFRADAQLLARLAALERKLGLSRTGVIQLAVARLAELERIEVSNGD